MCAGQRPGQRPVGPGQTGPPDGRACCQYLPDMAMPRPSHGEEEGPDNRGQFLPSVFLRVSEHRHARKTRAHCSPGPCVSAFQSHVSRAGSPAAGPDTPPPPAHRWSALRRASCHPADGQHLPLHGLRALPRTLKTMRGGTAYPWVPVGLACVFVRRPVA